MATIIEILSGVMHSSERKATLLLWCDNARVYEAEIFSTRSAHKILLLTNTIKEHVHYSTLAAIKFIICKIKICANNVIKPVFTKNSDLTKIFTNSSAAMSFLNLKIKI